MFLNTDSGGVIGINVNLAVQEINRHYTTSSQPNIFTEHLSSDK